MDSVCFFQPLVELVSEGKVVFNVEIGKNGYVLVSVLYSHEEVKDKLFKRIAPMVFKGYARELDEKLFAALANPMRKTVELAVNMLEYERTLEEVSKANMANQKKQAAKQVKVSKSIDLKKVNNDVEEEEGESVFPAVEKTAAEVSAEDRRKRFDKMMLEVEELASCGNYTGAWMKVPSIGEFPEMEDLITSKREEFSAKFAV